MNTNYFNADTRIFMVTFQYVSTCRTFLFQSSLDLVEIIKKHEKPGCGIESLKELDLSTSKFKKVSKKDFLQFASWDTEAMEFFKNHYYFKK